MRLPTRATGSPGTRGDVNTRRRQHRLANAAALVAVLAEYAFVLPLGSFHINPPYHALGGLNTATWFTGLGIATLCAVGALACLVRPLGNRWLMGVSLTISVCWIFWLYSELHRSCLRGTI